MAKTKSEVGATAEPGHDQGFGPVCLYKGEEPLLCNTEEELDAAIKDGWKDAPTKAEPKKATKKAEK